MEPYEIILIVVIALFVAFIFGREIYKIIKGKSGECACCKHNMNKALKKAKRALNKGNSCCNK